MPDLRAEVRASRAKARMYEEEMRSSTQRFNYVKSQLHLLMRAAPALFLDSVRQQFPQFNYVCLYLFVSSCLMWACFVSWQVLKDPKLEVKMPQSEQPQQGGISVIPPAVAMQQAGAQQQQADKSPSSLAPAASASPTSASPRPSSRDRNSDVPRVILSLRVCC